MSYGRRFSSPGLVRRGRRSYPRTVRLGYTTRKALRRGLPVRKRLLRQKMARPLKKRRIQTRPVFAPRTRSPFKCQREVISTSFFTTTSPAGLKQADQPNTSATLFALLLSPKSGTGINNYRSVEGSKGRYVGCNITGALSMDKGFSVQQKMSFVIRVIQVNLPDIIGGTDVDFGNDSTYMSEFWKEQEFSDGEYTYSNFADPTFAVRKYQAMNMSKFKVLKTKYITVNTANPEHKTKGFHFYIPMKAQLEKDRKMSAYQWDSFRALSSGRTSVSRYAYYKPIILAIEPVLDSGEVHTPTEVPFTGIDLSIKHTFKDGI